MFSNTQRLSHIVTMTLLAMGPLACEGKETTASAINCGAGTTLSAAGDACEANLSEGLSVNAAGEIVADPAGAGTEAALAAAREEGRAEGAASVDITTDNQAAFDEGAASVDITTDNQAAFDEGAASVDITTDNDAAREEGRAEGVASVTPLNCAEGTAENEAGDACEPTAEYRAAAVEEGRVAGFAAGRAEGIASLTPLNCAEGTTVNEVGDACEPTAEYRAAAVEEGRLAGVASVDITSNDADVIAAATADLLTQAEVAADYLSRVEVAAQYLSRDEVAAQYLSRDEVAAQYLSRDEVAANYVTREEAEAARQAGVESVTPLNCAEGTAENDAGDACEPNLSMDVAIDDQDIIVPTDAYDAQVCADGGGTFDAETGTCAPAYDCFRGGYCSAAAQNFGFGAEDGNVYVGDTRQSTGCDATQIMANDWQVGALVSLQVSLQNSTNEAVCR